MNSNPNRSQISLELPDDLARMISEVARWHNISDKQLIMDILATQVPEMASIQTEKAYLASRAARSSRAQFDQALAAVPNAAP